MFYRAYLIEINSFTLKINDEIVDTTTQFAIGDTNDNGLTDYSIKFSREAVQEMLSEDDTSVVISIIADISVTCDPEDVPVSYDVFGQYMIRVLDMW